jgi:hypothetical protein
MSLFFTSFKHLTLFFAKKKNQPYNETLAQKLVYSKIEIKRYFEVLE